MNTKNILIIVAVVLCVGLAIVISLSFQVVRDTKSNYRMPAASLPVETKNEKQSIYGLDVATGEKKVIHVYGTEHPQEGKPKTAIPLKHIKTLELEQAELATGVQPDQTPAPITEETISSRGSTISKSQPVSSVAQTGQPQNTNPPPTQEQLQDLQKKGILLF